MIRLTSLYDRECRKNLNQHRKTMSKIRDRASREFDSYYLIKLMISNLEDTMVNPTELVGGKPHAKFFKWEMSTKLQS